MTYSYLTPLFKIGATKVLEEHDLYPLEKENTAEFIADLFENSWITVRNGENSPGYNVFKASMHAFGW